MTFLIRYKLVLIPMKRYAHFLHNVAFLHLEHFPQHPMIYSFVVLNMARISGIVSILDGCRQQTNVITG